jgi:two-component system sensor histidine kinase KdpD
MTEGGDHRPSPEALMREARAEGRGRLKIYLGAAPGVGKTYEMLTDARKKRAEGLDIVAGVVETHGRGETLALCQGLEIIPKHKLGYRGRELEDMDLDALIARKPKIALVDELAHTNVEGARHPKRWMDVEELLAAGIDVWSTLNIQHLESLNDVVAKITHVRVRETVPDALLERADEIELIDLTPDELIQRLREGKVYAPDQAERALRHYFAPGNLSALRELAMRRAADRIDIEVREHRLAQRETAPWAAGERILVCVDDRQESLEVVRHAKRLADRAKAAWVAVHVQSARNARLSQAERDRIAEALRLAARLGAETATLPGDNIAQSLLDFAREQNVTQIVVGKAKRPPLFELLFGSVVRGLVNGSETIAIYVVPEDEAGAKKRRLAITSPWPALTPLSIFEGFALTAIATSAAWLLDARLDVDNLTLVYLPAVLISALTRGLWAGLFTGLASVLAFNWFFTEPRHTFTVASPDNVLAIVSLSGAALVVALLASRARSQTLTARNEARISREMFDLAKGLASVASEDEVAQALAAFSARAFSAECAVLARVGVSDVRLAGAAPGPANLSEADMAAARWTMDKGQPAGRGADTLPGARWLFVPMRTSRLFAGVLALARGEPLTPAERRRLDAMADQGASALERAHLARAYEEGRVEREAERMRSAVLDSLSHDLKTPIAGVLGAASSLRAYGDKHDAAIREELLASIETEALRMQRYVVKLLDMTRLASGAVKSKAEAVDVGDVVAAVIKRAEPLAEGIWLDGDVDPGLPLLRTDEALLQQALFNLVENAIVHGAKAGGGEVRLCAHMRDGGVVFEVIDDGPGLPAGSENKLFEKFYRGEAAMAGGTGLGLPIAKGFADLMGAAITAQSRRDRSGAVFTLAFPESAAA